MIPASFTIVLFLIAAPPLIFALGFLQLGPGLAAAALAGAALGPILRRTDWRGTPDRPILVAALAIAAVLTLVSGIGHFFWQTDDWMVRDAILFDLARHPWPVAYSLGAADGLLRAPLGMYLAPALIGKIGGPGAAQAALFIQNTAVIGLCLYVFARALPAGRARVIALVLFVAFSGADCVAWVRARLDGLQGLALPHLEPWPGFFHYDSNVTEIFWTPHHALAGWALVAGYLVWREGRISAMALGPLLAASVFWSPLAALGALPFLGFAFLCDALDRRLRGGDFAIAVAAGLAALPVVVYLTRDSGGVEKGFQDLADPKILRSYAAMMALEVLPLLAMAWHGRDKDDRRGLIEFALIAASLLAIPLYKLGFANDFAMRVSIPALALLYVRCVPALAEIGREPIARRAAMLLIFGLGAATPAVEIYRNVTQRPTPASACNVLESLKDGPYAGSPLDYYIASRSSFDRFADLFRPAAAAPLTRRIEKCWPGRTFVYEKVGAKK